MRTSADEVEAVFSPDGQWVAYQSNLSGPYEIYVQRYPDGALSQVWTEGGQRPLWNPKGGEIFYQKSTQVFAVRIGNGERVGSSVPLFDRSNSIERNWSVAPDGQTFLVRQATQPIQTGGARQ